MMNMNYVGKIFKLNILCAIVWTTERLASLRGHTVSWDISWRQNAFFFFVFFVSVQLGPLAMEEQHIFL